MKSKLKTTFKFYSDPGHGWLAVKRDLLEELGILHKVSGFSYQRGKTVYLEEDRDTALFVEAYSRKISPLKAHFVERHTNKSSPIRSYDRFDSGPQENEGVHSDDCDKRYGGKCSCGVENECLRCELGCYSLTVLTQ